MIKDENGLGDIDVELAKGGRVYNSSSGGGAEGRDAINFQR